MIQNESFRSAVERSFSRAGFTSSNKVMRFSGDAATLLVSLEKFEFASQFFINVGFWLRGLNGKVPAKVELTHLYFRLERLFPEHREAILAACELNSELQPAALDRLGELIEMDLGPTLQRLASSATEMKKRYLEGALKGGLIRREAKDFLET